jgi:hypothetical protein
VPWTFTAAGWQGGSDFIVPQESSDFSATMAENASETPFGRIVTEKEPCFFGTMINNRPPRRFLVKISQQCFSNDAGVLWNKSISL